MTDKMYAIVLAADDLVYAAESVGAVVETRELADAVCAKANAVPHPWATYTVEEIPVVRSLDDVHVHAPVRATIAYDVRTGVASAGGETGREPAVFFSDTDVHWSSVSEGPDSIRVTFTSHRMSYDELLAMASTELAARKAALGVGGTGSAFSVRCPVCDGPAYVERVDVSEFGGLPQYAPGRTVCLAGCDLRQARIGSESSAP